MESSKHRCVSCQGAGRVKIPGEGWFSEDKYVRCSACGGVGYV